MEIDVATSGQFLTEMIDPSQAGEARRVSVELTTAIGMNETECGKIAISVTEIATNLIKHAQQGKLLCETVRHNGSCGFRVLSLDRGPGIPNISAALQDGYSTYGSSGNGLGAVRRLSTVFDLYSQPKIGTCILAEFWQNRKPNATQSFSLGVVSVAMRGEPVCGDGWGMRTTPDRSFFMVVDGLGHGILAAEAAREAERVLADSHCSSASTIVRDLHDALKKTRGAAAAVAEISQEKGTLTYAGIGNTSATVIDGANRRGIASHNGTLGHQMHKIQEFTVPWNEDSLLIMHSDGLASRWDLKQYPGLASKHPSIIGAMLYRDFQREKDDVTVMAVKNGHQVVV
jgi:anti-sigma regulatory factor (Ser/Thr protein kinase)